MRQRGWWVGGFSLIELLVAMTIIAILAAITIPNYLFYRRKGVDAEMQSGIRAGKSSMEAYYTEHVSYEGVTLADLENKGYRASPGTTLAILSATPTEYRLRVCASGGSFLSIFYDSTVGADVFEDAAC